MDSITSGSVRRCNGYLAILAAVAVAIILMLVVGCATTVHFDSEPQGASVSYKGEVIGVTPFDYSLHDEFGWFSTYTFLAWKQGFVPVVQSVSEPVPASSQSVVAPRLTFKLSPAAPK